MRPLILSSTTAVSLLTASSHAYWQPTPGTTWAIQLAPAVTPPYPNVAVYDFDLFDNPASTVAAVHAQGAKVVCYFSAGSWENWRPDASDFPKSALGSPLSGWKGERWLNTTSPAVRTLMQKRMDLAVQKGCDAIDPDNIDAYDNGGGGFHLEEADAVNYVQFLASEAHSRGLACGLKNGGAIVPSVLADVQFQVNEQCVQFNECSMFRPFLEAGKPVFEIEYVNGTPSASKVDGICDQAQRKGFSTLIKHTDLGSFVVACPSNATVSITAPSGTGSGAQPSSSVPIDNASAALTALGLLSLAPIFGMFALL